MKTYSCYFIDRTLRPVRYESVQCADDRTVADTARRGPVITGIIDTRPRKQRWLRFPATKQNPSQASCLAGVFLYAIAWNAA